MVAPIFVWVGFLQASALGRPTWIGSGYAMCVHSASAAKLLATQTANCKLQTTTKAIIIFIIQNNNIIMFFVVPLVYWTIFFLPLFALSSEPAVCHQLFCAAFMSCKWICDRISYYSFIAFAFGMPACLPATRNTNNIINSLIWRYAVCQQIYRYIDTRMRNHIIGSFCGIAHRKWFD